MTVQTHGPRGRWPWVLTVLAIPALVLGIPFSSRAAIPPDEPAAAWVAPYVHMARQSLANNDDLGLPHFRFIGTRCGGDAVAFLFERRSYPYLTSIGAYALTGNWPPRETGAFAGSLYVVNFDQSLREEWLPRQSWHECEPR